jgi:hypothetical protein
MMTGVADRQAMDGRFDVRAKSSKLPRIETCPGQKTVSETVFETVL